jgi:cell division protein FtsN
MRTPELNMQALAAQGNLTEEKIKLQQQKEVVQNEAIASNKYSGNVGASSEAIRNTLQTPTDPQRNSIQADDSTIEESDIITTNEGQKSKDVVEYSLNDSSKKDKVKTTAKASAVGAAEEEVAAATTTQTAAQNVAISKKQKGIFVQTGSFSTMQHAKNSLATMEKFSTKSAKAKIEEAQSGEKTVYRVLIGPFANKQKAAAMVAKIKKSGHQAIIIKNK